MNKKSQSALEFLSTYAWAFIIIIISIAALYYFGIFNFDQYLPQNCIFTNQFKCVDFALVNNVADQEVRFRLINNVGEDIQVTAFDITNDATPPIQCTYPSGFAWGYSLDHNFTFIDCFDGGFVEGNRVELIVTLNYYALKTPSQPIHQIKGKINGKVIS